MSSVAIRFDWSLLNRKYISDFIFSIAPSVTTIDISIDEIHKKISARIKQVCPVKIKKSFIFSIGKEAMWIGGNYDYVSDKMRKKCIVVELAYPIKTDILYITKIRFRSICNAIADTIFHELIHMRQYRRRKFNYIHEYNSIASTQKLRIEQTYLGCNDEIDAYAFNIACELTDKFKGDCIKISNYLDENQSHKKRIRGSWFTYLKAFEHDHSHVVLQKLKRKIVNYLPNAKKGKPFSDKKWISS